MSIGTEWPIFAIDISQKIVHSRECFLVRLAISFYFMEYLQTEPLLLKYAKISQNSRRKSNWYLFWCLNLLSYQSVSTFHTCCELAEASQFVPLLRVYPENIYLLKVNNKNNRKRCEISSKLRLLFKVVNTLTNIKILH